MMKIQRSPWLPGCLSGCLLGALLATGACRDDGTGSTAQDMRAPTTTTDDLLAVDLATKVAKNTTIREINTTAGQQGGTIAIGDRVKFSGVVVSPYMWTDDDQTTGYCTYRIALMQADGSASTLQDGMVVQVSLKTTFMGDMSAYAQCGARAKTFNNVQAMDMAKVGHLVEIDAELSTRGKTGPRQIDLYFGSLADKGVAPMMPVPVAANPADFVPGSPLPQKFFDSNGVLVKFSNVKINSRDTRFQDFKVSTESTGGAFIATNYLRATSSSYMSPMDGTTLSTVIGLVLPDFSGRIWARTTDDIKM